MSESPVELIKQDFLQTQESFNQLTNLLDQWEANPQADLQAEVFKELTRFAGLGQRSAIKAAILLGVDQTHAVIIRQTQ